MTRRSLLSPATSVRLTVAKEVVTTDRSGSVGKFPKASSNIPEAVVSGDIIIRRRPEECASIGFEGLAGETCHWDGVEQYGSVVSWAKSKACDRSMSATAEWVGVRCIGPTTPNNKSQSSDSRGSEQRRGDKARWVSMRFYLSSVGVVSASGGA